ncbi:MAG TPA: DUF4331 family protein [Anaerolineae bacterium]|nr:DUF4331 family protein [Anaerolineae bacterium]HMR67276.1 DUF4331 family protein [Anaerolineae bacterium]
MKKIIAMLGVLGLVAIALSIGVAARPSRAADHLDAPGLTPPGGIPALDINDVYAFQSPANKKNTVLIMTVSPAAGAIGPTTFDTKGRYQFFIDTNSDARENIRIVANFGKVEKKGQRVTVRWSGPGLNENLAQGWTNEVLKKGDAKVFAGLVDDPFFFDLNGFLGADGRSFCDGKEQNFFLGLNTLAIAVEVPSKWFGPSQIGVWARTGLAGNQIDRMGRPAINTVFVPNNPFEPAGTEPSQKNNFNAGKPKNDQGNFRGEVVDTLELFYGAGAQQAQDLANVLLPDILTVDTSSSDGFLNGRKLADDVIDAELALVTNGQVPSDCVGNDSAFRDSFPYLAPAN